jgi:acetyltransferase-like isoleucine patch superfamily enzyme
MEQGILAMFGWVPTILGIAARAVAYRLILRMNGIAAIESGVRLRFARHISLDHGSYLDERVYLHAIHIGKNSLVMHGSVLHVYNFRGIPQSGIWIGENSLIGEYNVIRGQGGIRIGNRVFTSPMVQLLAVNHVFDDPTQSFSSQGITAQGITIEDDVWVGSGSVVTDGVTIGKGAVVAAGSVVTSYVAPHTVVGGVPARLLKTIDGASKVPEGRRIYFDAKV